MHPVHAYDAPCERNVRSLTVRAMAAKVGELSWGRSRSDNLSLKSEKRMKAFTTTRRQSRKRESDGEGYVAFDPILPETPGKTKKTPQETRASCDAGATEIPEADSLRMFGVS